MIFDIFGWIGAVLMLLAYMLLSTGKIENSYLYQIINLIAAVCMGIGLFPKNAWFSFSLEIIWGIIAVVSIIKIKNKKSN